MKQSNLVPKENWIRVAHTHDAIIERPVFEEVQRLLQFDTRTSPDRNEVYALSGMVFCGDCGNSMVRRRVQKKFSYLHCNTHKNGQGCTTHLISTKRLEELVLEGIQTQISLILNADAILQKIDRIPEEQVYVRTITKQIEELQKEIERFQKLKTQAYVDMLNETISKEEYETINQRFTKGLESAVKKRDEQIKTKARLLKSNTHHRPWIEAFRRFQNIQTLDRQIVAMLVDRIIVYSKDRIEIVFRFQQEIEEMLRLVESAVVKNEKEETVCAS